MEVMLCICMPPRSANAPSSKQELFGAPSLSKHLLTPKLHWHSERQPFELRVRPDLSDHVVLKHGSRTAHAQAAAHLLQALVGDVVELQLVSRSRRRLGALVRHPRRRRLDSRGRLDNLDQEVQKLSFLRAADRRSRFVILISFYITDIVVWCDCFYFSEHDVDSYAIS